MSYLRIKKPSVWMECIEKTSKYYKCRGYVCSVLNGLTTIQGVNGVSFSVPTSHLAFIFDDEIPYQSQTKGSYHHV